MFTFRELQAREISQALAFIEASLPGAVSSEEHSAFQAQLKRSLLQHDMSSTHSLACFDDEALVGIGIYFFDYSIVRDARSLNVEDIYTPPHRMDVAGAIIRQLAKLAVKERCTHIEWSSIDYPLAEESHADDPAAGVDGTTSYRLSGDALIALANR